MLMKLIVPFLQPAVLELQITRFDKIAMGYKKYASQQTPTSHESRATSFNDLRGYEK
jgi:hypothetical protein